MPTYGNDPVISRNHTGTPEFLGGVYGESKLFNGVRGVSYAPGHGAVVGVHEAPENQGPGVFGQGSPGVYGESHMFNGVRGVSHAAGHGAVVGVHQTNQGPGIYGEGAPAGFFKGDVVVTGDVILQGADYAEALTVADQEVLPGMVVVLDDEGRITPCTQEYDTRVAGIVSGAGGVRPALVLDRHDGGAPVALMGKLWVMVDATGGPVRCGDQLTTSSTPGHARVVTDRARAFGAVVGKALTALPGGVGMVRVLVSAS